MGRQKVLATLYLSQSDRGKCQRLFPGHSCSGGTGGASCTFGGFRALRAPWVTVQRFPDVDRIFFSSGFFRRLCAQPLIKGGPFAVVVVGTQRRQAARPTTGSTCPDIRFTRVRFTFTARRGLTLCPPNRSFFTLKIRRRFVLNVRSSVDKNPWAMPPANTDIYIFLRPPLNATVHPPGRLLHPPYSYFLSSAHCYITHGTNR